jgi:hypothetical protein
MTTNNTQPSSNNAQLIENTINSTFIDCFEHTTAEHMKFCNCQRELYDKYINRAIELCDIEIDKEIKESGVKDFDRKHRHEDARRQGIKAASKYCIMNDIRCYKEKDEVQNTINLFLTKYPSSIDDPIFIEVIKSVLNHQLVVHRLKKASSEHGVLQYWTDRNGNERITVSPLLEAQREFDKVKVDALMILDKKLNGEKSVNLNMNVDITRAIEEIHNKYQNN